MSLSVSQLKDMKKELKDFSQAPITKSYRLIAQIYKSKLSPQDLVDSEISKAFIRIGAKQFKESDDEKYQKSIKICRKMIKQWKETLKGDLLPNQFEQKTQQQQQIKKEPVIQKKVKITNGKPEMQENRVKAIKGLLKYLQKHVQGEYDQIIEAIEEEIYQNFKDEEIYKEKVKCMAIKIDQNKEFRDKIISSEYSPKVAVKSLVS